MSKANTLDMKYLMVSAYEGKISYIITTNKEKILSSLEEHNKKSIPVIIFGVKDSPFHSITRLDNHDLKKRLSNFVSPARWSEEEKKRLIEIMESNPDVDNNKFYRLFISSGFGRTKNAVIGMKSRVRRDFIAKQKKQNPKFHNNGICKYCHKDMIPRLISQGNNGDTLVKTCPHCYNTLPK